MFHCQQVICQGHQSHQCEQVVISVNKLYLFYLFTLMASKIQNRFPSSECYVTYLASRGAGTVLDHFLTLKLVQISV